MQCISPVFVFRSAALASALLLAACGSDAQDDAAPTTTADTSADDATATTEGADAPEDNAESVTTDSAVTTDETTTTEAPAEEPDDDVARLCTAYLDSITFGTVDIGLEALVEIMGPDAPSGVQGALDTLAHPEGDIEGFFAAQNSVDGYILPICRDRFAASIVPAADDAAAADEFVAAIRDGDLVGAEMLAPTNVITSFDWNGFPDATWNFDADNSTVSMLLEPTVTVFCQIADAAIEACAFGE